jgi:hypothetical protein
MNYDEMTAQQEFHQQQEHEANIIEEFASLITEKNVNVVLTYMVNNNFDAYEILNKSFKGVDNGNS